MAERGSFWTSTAAIITAIGSLLAAIVALATFMVSQDWFSSAGSRPPGPEPSYVGIPDDKFFGPREIRLDDFGMVELDESPPGRGGYSGDIYFSMDKTASGDALFLWEAESTPSGSDCATYLSTLSTSKRLLAAPGSKICVHTDEGRTALVVVKSVDGQWSMEVTVWAHRDL